MTAEERESFRKVAAAVKARRTIQESRAIARKSPLTRRLRGPKWLASNPVGKREVNIERPATAGELAQLAKEPTRGLHWHALSG